MAMHIYSVLTSPDEKEFDYADRWGAKESMLISMCVYDYVFSAQGVSSTDQYSLCQP
jgi:hypothetical protein